MPSHPSQAARLAPDEVPAALDARDASPNPSPNPSPAAALVASLPVAGAISLGPATVLRQRGAGVVEVRLERGPGTALARFAMPIPYEPCVGDSLLVIGSADGHYVIGVLAGAGQARLEVDGDLSLRAVGGALHLRADKGVHVEAPEISLLGRKVGMVAERLVQRFTHVHQRVAELFELSAGESKTTVEGAHMTQAKSATVLTKEAVVINGKAVHLG